MPNPGDLIRRARRNRAQRQLREAREVSPQTPPAMPPQLHRGAYNELMRNHDRVNTRHIGRKNDGGGA